VKLSGTQRHAAGDSAPEEEIRRTAPIASANFVTNILTTLRWPRSGPRSSCITITNRSTSIPPDVMPPIAAGMPLAADDYIARVDAAITIEGNPAVAVVPVVRRVVGKRGYSDIAISRTSTQAKTNRARTHHKQRRAGQ
jgi:hypothetical protein